MFKYVLGPFFKSKSALLFVAISIANYLMAIAVPYLNGTFVDFLILNTSIQDILNFAILIAFINLIGIALKYAYSMVGIKASTNAVYLILIDLIKKYERIELRSIEKIEAAYMTQRIFTDVNTVSKFVIDSFLEIPLGILVSIGIAVFFLQLDPMFSFMSAALIVLYLFAFLKFEKLLQQAALERKEADSKFFEAINSQIGNVFDIQLNARFNRSISAIADAYSLYLPKIMHSSKINYSFSSIDGLISALFQAVLLIISGVEIIQGSMSVGDYFMANSYFYVLLKCAKNFASCFQQWQDSTASFKRIEEISDLKTQTSGNLKIENIRQISIEKLTFPFSPSNNPHRVIFKDFCCTFKAATTYAVVGKNGSGKSTLLKLITGLYDSGNAIKYNHEALDTIDRDFLLSTIISTVPQRISTFPQTVSECIYGNIDPETLQKLSETKNCELALYAKSIERQLDSRCESLSGGELRKLHLWIAFNKPHQVLVLDEPTTGLDAVAKKAFCDYLAQNRKNDLVIVMTHDDSVIASCNKIIKIG